MTSAREERRRAARSEIEREDRKLEAIFDAVDVGLLLLDRDGRYVWMNRRHEETMCLPFPDGHGVSPDSSGTSTTSTAAPS